MCAYANMLSFVLDTQIDADTGAHICYSTDFVIIPEINVHNLYLYMFELPAFATQ